MTWWRLDGARIDEVLEWVNEATADLGVSVTAERREAITADLDRGGPTAAVVSAAAALLSRCAADVDALQQHMQGSSAAVASARRSYDSAQADMQAATAVSAAATRLGRAGREPDA